LSTYSFSNKPKYLIQSAADEELGIVVCIPCYNEPNILRTINSLTEAEQKDIKVECIVLINTPQNVSGAIRDQNIQSYGQLADIKNINVHAIHVQDIPEKIAGVGLARKLAMDEAAFRLESSRSEIKVISCFDADCTCSSNYFSSLYKHFTHSNNEAVSIYMEHPQADITGTNTQKAIYLYELHLRYFIQYQRDLLLPFAYHTIGSSMACTVNGYRRVGGMNKRKAGEDFYFLHKFIKDDQCGLLADTVVYPSGRESDRVPFGTGKAVADMLNQDLTFSTYNPASFEMLRPLVNSIASFYREDYEAILRQYPEPLKMFLISIEFEAHIEKIKSNTTSIDRFKKGVFQYFNAFILMKYLHFMRDNYCPNVPVQEAAKHLLEKLSVSTETDQLNAFRDIDKKLG